MGKKATAADGDLILKLYDLRREPVMRQARAEMIARFVPKSWDEFSAVTKNDLAPLRSARVHVGEIGRASCRERVSLTV